MEIRLTTQPQSILTDSSTRYSSFWKSRIYAHYLKKQHKKYSLKHTRKLLVYPQSPQLQPKQRAYLHVPGGKNQYYQGKGNPHIFLFDAVRRPHHAST